MTTREFLTEQCGGEHFNKFYRHNVIPYMYEYAKHETAPLKDRIAQLESELQTAVGEVNRLNAFIAGSCGNFADGLG